MPDDLLLLLLVNALMTSSNSTCSTTSFNVPKSTLPGVSINSFDIVRNSNVYMPDVLSLMEAYPAFICGSFYRPLYSRQSTRIWYMPTSTPSLADSGNAADDFYLTIATSGRHQPLSPTFGVYAAGGSRQALADCGPYQKMLAIAQPITDVEAFVLGSPNFKDLWSLRVYVSS